VKTISLKKVAAVAVASIAFGGLSSISPAFAAGTGEFTPTIGAVKGSASDAATVTGITTGVVAASFNHIGTSTVYFSATGSTITTVGLNGGSGAIVKANGSTYGDGFSVTGATAADDTTVTLTSATAGTSVLTAYSLSGTTGVRTTIATLTITWTAASALDLGSAKAYVLANGATCNASTAASTVGSMNYALASGSALVLCVVLKDNSSATFTGTATVNVVGNGIGQVAGAAVYSSTTSTGYKSIAIYGNGLPGTATYAISASATNADATTATKTASASVIANGDFTALTLSVAKKSIVASAATTGVLGYSAVDTKGNAAAVDLQSGAKWYISSDKSTDALTSTAPNNSSTAAAATGAAGITAATGASDAAGLVTLTPTAATYEKLSIYVTKTNAAGVTITSNKVEVYVSTTTVKSMVISAVNGTASGSQTVTVTAYADPATTGTGTLYPVVDTEAITLAASAGMLSATALTTDKTGTASATLFSPQLSGTSTISASAESGTVTATKTITISGGGLDSTMTAIDALNAKIVALNALIAKIMKKLGIK
jgi:hypothetical protein